MNARPLTALLLLALFLASAPLTHARVPSAHDDYSADSMALDAIFARPLLLAATVIGSGVFVASLPITLISRSTGLAAKTLVGKPAHMTFTRKLGDFSGIE